MHVKKAGGAAYTDDDQISCVNFFAAFIFDVVKVLIGGQEVCILQYNCGNMMLIDFFIIDFLVEMNEYTKM